MSHPESVLLREVSLSEVDPGECYIVRGETPGSGKEIVCFLSGKEVLAHLKDSSVSIYAADGFKYRSPSTADKFDREEFIKRFAQEILAERTYQDTKWGSSFDRNNTPNDWALYVCQQVSLATPIKFDPAVFRERMLKAAAVCAAAVEWCDRVEGHMPARHYD